MSEAAEPKDDFDSDSDNGDSLSIALQDGLGLYSEDVWDTDMGDLLE